MAERELKQCEHCRAIFDARQRYGTRKRFCSRQCAYSIKRIRLTCAACGNEFASRVCEAHRKYCSTRCAGVAANRVAKTCEACGNVYTVIPSQAAGSRTCSRTCQAKRKSIAARERNANNPRARLSTKGWAKLRLQIIARDGNRCTSCGYTGPRLNVHHIVPWRESQDDSPENLVTVCTGCHRRAEAVA